MVGSLAKSLMKKAVRIAGDGAKMAEIVILGSADYDIATGTVTRNDTPYAIGKAVVSRVSAADLAKFALQSTTHRATIAMLDYEAAGSPALPEPSDRITLDGKPWLIDKVVFGSMGHSIIFFVSAAEMP